MDPPSLEHAPSDAGVEAFVDFQGLSSERATPASLDKAGVGTVPGTAPLWLSRLPHGLREVRCDSALWGDSGTSLLRHKLYVDFHPFERYRPAVPWTILHAVEIRLEAELHPNERKEISQWQRKAEAAE